MPEALGLLTLVLSTTLVLGLAELSQNTTHAAARVAAYSLRVSVVLGLFGWSWGLLPHRALDITSLFGNTSTLVQVYLTALSAAGVGYSWLDLLAQLRATTWELRMFRVGVAGALLAGLLATRRVWGLQDPSDRELLALTVGYLSALLVHWTVDRAVQHLRPRSDWPLGPDRRADALPCWSWDDD